MTKMSSPPSSVWQVTPMVPCWAFTLSDSLPAVRPATGWVPLLAILSPVLSFLLSQFSEELFNGYQFGFELLIVNGAIMFVALLLTSRKVESL